MVGIDVTLDTSQVLGFGSLLKASAASTPARAGASVRKTATAIESTMKDLCPVLTGELRDSISSDVSGLRAEIGAATRYAEFVEDGTSVMAPEPFAGPAFDQHDGELEKALARDATGL